MNDEIDHDDEAVIDIHDTYTDGDGLSWSIVSLDVNARTVTVEAKNPPWRTIPLSDLEKMECSREAKRRDGGLIVGGTYTDGDQLRWLVKAVNLRDRTAILMLMNPPKRTIPVSDLRSMRSQNREWSELRRKVETKTGPAS